MDKVLNQAVRACLDEINKPDTNKMLKDEFMNPIVNYIGQRIWPYIMVACVFFTILCFVLVSVIYMIYKQSSKVQQLT